MAVHFPTALLIIDIVFVVTAILLDNEIIARAAYYCLLGGVITGWITLLTGFADFFWYILRPRTGAARAGLIHGGIQSSVVLAFTFIASYEYHHQMAAMSPPWWMWVVKTVLVLVLLVGNYLGAELLYKYVIREIQH